MAMVRVRTMATAIRIRVLVMASTLTSWVFIHAPSSGPNQ